MAPARALEPGLDPAIVVKQTNYLENLEIIIIILLVISMLYTEGQNIQKAGLVRYYCTSPGDKSQVLAYIK